MGLRTALYELIDAWRERNRGVNTSVTITDQLTEIHETVGITAYRVVQECLTNISKHAKARLVIIKVVVVKDFIRILVEDHGQGFQKDVHSTGLGLAGMKERVQGLGGVFEVTSEQGVGTTVEVHLPINFKVM